jgi:hypothetical protein
MLKIELLCLRDVIRFGQRHRRYWLIALGLLLESLLNWRGRRILRVGFCFLQHLDDILDGDRATEREPLDIADEVVQAIHSNTYGASDLMCLAQAFIGDLRAIGGENAIQEALALIAVMRRDRCRVMDKVLFSRSELIEHHRATFNHSINLMLIARRSPLRAGDVPELIDSLAWCSSVRDLQEDWEAGLVNIPREVLAAARLNGATPWPVLLANQLVRDWIKSEHQQAKQRLLEMEQKLPALKPFPGYLHLRIFVKSIQKFSEGRFLKLYPFIEK